MSALVSWAKLVVATVMTGVVLTVAIGMAADETLAWEDPAFVLSSSPDEIDPEATFVEETIEVVHTQSRTNDTRTVFLHQMGGPPASAVSLVAVVDEPDAGAVTVQATLPAGPTTAGAGSSVPLVVTSAVDPEWSGTAKVTIYATVASAVVDVGDISVSRQPPHALSVANAQGGTIAVAAPSQETCIPIALVAGPSGSGDAEVRLTFLTGPADPTRAAVVTETGGDDPCRSGPDAGGRSRPEAQTSTAATDDTNRATDTDGATDNTEAATDDADGPTDDTEAATDGTDGATDDVRSAAEVDETTDIVQISALDPHGSTTLRVDTSLLRSGTYRWLLAIGQTDGQTGGVEAPTTVLLTVERTASPPPIEVVGSTTVNRRLGAFELDKTGGFDLVLGLRPLPGYASVELGPIRIQSLDRVDDDGNAEADVRSLTVEDGAGLELGDGFFVNGATDLTLSFGEMNEPGRYKGIALISEPAGTAQEVGITVNVRRPWIVLVFLLAVGIYAAEVVRNALGRQGEARGVESALGEMATNQKAWDHLVTGGTPDDDAVAIKAHLEGREGTIRTTLRKRGSVPQILFSPFSQLRPTTSCEQAAKDLVEIARVTPHFIELRDLRNANAATLDPSAGGAVSAGLDSVRRSVVGQADITGLDDRLQAIRTKLVETIVVAQLTGIEELEALLPRLGRIPDQAAASQVQSILALGLPGVRSNVHQLRFKEASEARAAIRSEVVTVLIADLRARCTKARLQELAPELSDADYRSQVADAVIDEIDGSPGWSGYVAGVTRLLDHRYTTLTATAGTNAHQLEELTRLIEAKNGKELGRAMDIADRVHQMQRPHTRLSPDEEQRPLAAFGPAVLSHPVGGPSLTEVGAPRRGSLAWPPLADVALVGLAILGTAVAGYIALYDNVWGRWPDVAAAVAWGFGIQGASAVIGGALLRRLLSTAT